MPSYKQPIKRVPGSLKLVEMMETVQGEGFFIGIPSVFVRTGMCNLCCSGCDTVWDDWTPTRAENVAEKIRTFKSRHVVLTGGEPTLWQDDLMLLLDYLDSSQFGEYTITVETNGAVPIRNDRLLQRVNLWSFSPKVGSLGHDEKFSHEVVLNNIAEAEWIARQSNHHVQIKYVLDPYIPEHVDSVFAFQARVDALENEYVGLALSSDKIYFQPYDRDCTVNAADRSVPGAPLSIRNAPLDEHGYAKDLAALTKIVMGRSESRFRVLPQLHKLLIWR